MIDVAGLAGTPTAADFVFRIGNSNASGVWTLAPAPASITVRAGAGVNGTDRVTLIWTDDAIRNTWLQVVVLPTAHTGLTQAQTFYFGNAIGETGNSTANAIVNSTDVMMTRTLPYTASYPASITVNTDFNRDGLVNESDQLIVSSHLTGPQTALKLITPDGAFGAATIKRAIRLLQQLVLRRQRPRRRGERRCGHCPRQNGTAPHGHGNFRQLHELQSGYQRLDDRRRRAWKARRPRPTSSSASATTIRPIPGRPRLRPRASRFAGAPAATARIASRSSGPTARSRISGCKSRSAPRETPVCRSPMYSISATRSVRRAIRRRTP